MKNTLIATLLKAKKNSADEIESVIEAYLRDARNLNKSETDKFVSELLVFVMQKVEEIDKDTLLRIVEAKISALGYTVNTTAVEAIYEKTALASAAEVGAVFAFDRTDAQTLESVNRALLFMKEDGTLNTQNRLKEILAKALEGEVKLSELGEVLRSEFEGVVDESARYFEGVSDHIIRQSQNLTRAYQFDKAGIKEVKVVAKIDSRTSQVCRSLNGRIIQVKDTVTQADAVTNATTIEEKKKVARWQSKPIFGSLPQGVALPPYHFRCRTFVVAYFRQNVEIDGKNVNGSLLPGEKYNGKEVLFSHVDKNFQREYVVTDATFNHGGNPHNIPKKDVIAGLNSLEKMAVHKEFPTRTIGYSHDKKLFYVFEDGEVVTVFDQRKKDYFKINAELSTIESHSNVKKGDTDESI